jgi:hypothetical protein
MMSLIPFYCYLKMFLGERQGNIYDMYTTYVHIMGIE